MLIQCLKSEAEPEDCMLGYATQEVSGVERREDDGAINEIDKRGDTTHR